MKPRGQLTPQEQANLTESLKKKLPRVYDVFHIGNLDDEFCEKFFKPYDEERYNHICYCMRGHRSIHIPGNFYVLGDLTTDYFERIKTDGRLYVEGRVQVNYTDFQIQGNCFIKGQMSWLHYINVGGSFFCHGIRFFNGITVGKNFEIHDLLVVKQGGSVRVGKDMTFLRTKGLKTGFVPGGYVSHGASITVGGSFITDPNNSDYEICAKVTSKNGGG